MSDEMETEGESTSYSGDDDVFLFRWPVRERNAELFPASFLTTIRKPLSFLTFEPNVAHSTEFASMTLETYRRMFSTTCRCHARRVVFDLHSKAFQDFALRVTRDLPCSTRFRLSAQGTNGDKRLIRARVYAISSRSELWWDGSRLDEGADRVLEKGAVLQRFAESLKLYDWARRPLSPVDSGTLETIPLSRIETSVVVESTQIVTIRVLQEAIREAAFSESAVPRVAWLNLANAYHVCGAYSIASGSQEEHVASAGTFVATLSACGSRICHGPKGWLLGAWAEYDHGFHIPPGGSYYCLGRFVTGQEADEQLEVGMIATAFCDLRQYVPFAYPNTERSDFYTCVGNLRNMGDFRRRLKLDIIGTLRTANAEGVEILIAGASGCGAFRHDPWFEAELWKECLAEMDQRGTSVRQVVFAILDGEESQNVRAFRSLFDTRD